MRTRKHEHTELDHAYARLREVLADCGSLAVAFSGGVDSGLVAYVAHDVLGDRSLAVIGTSPSLAARELDGGTAFLERHGIPYERLDTFEMNDARYRENGPKRCFFCKAELFARLAELSRRRGIERIAYGANLDDRGDYRPGSRAAAEYAVVAPLVDAGFTKTMVREQSRRLGLELWDKPAAPCLASRLPYGTEVTPERLRQVEDMEDALKDLGFAVCRARHFGDLVRIELPAADLERAGRLWRRVRAAARTAGFAEAALDRRGFRSGRLNEALGQGWRGPD